MTKRQVGDEHYLEDRYDNKPRFASYWHQIDEIRKTEPESVLEVGIGNGLVRDYLSRLNVPVVTLDIDNQLKPDLVGSVLDLPITDAAYDTVVCCQVLEHLPFSDFPRALAELTRVSKRYLIISLPDVNRVANIQGRVPGVGNFHALLPIPRLKPPVHTFDGEHYWEIGKMDYPKRLIIERLVASGLKLLRTYRVPENPYHRFFIMAPSR